MNKFLFYSRVVFPNLIFLSVYLLFFTNRYVFTASANDFTWLGYSFSVFFLVSLSIYLNRQHRIRLTFEQREKCLEKLRTVFYKKGYRLQTESANHLYFNKALVQSSFFTPGVVVHINHDHFMLEGPKVKVDYVAEWFEEMETKDLQIIETEYLQAS